VTAPRHTPDLSEFGLDTAAVRRLDRARARLIYLIGDSDTGKTTLAEAIADRLAPQFTTALVDLDAGQATVGLPTTFAWRLLGRRRRAWPDGVYFTGTTSPSGHFDIAVAGAEAMVAEARMHARKMVVDTCGLARGAAGAALHHAMTDALRPDAIVVIQRESELAGLAEALGSSGRWDVIHAAAPEAIRPRSRAARRSYRRGRFRDYFARARERVLLLDTVEVLRPRPDPLGRIASLRGPEGRDRALAIVRSVGRAGDAMTVLTPLAARAPVSAVVLGSMRIARDGRQLARNV
jgi:polynucleotide 5'-kinase involved in rRNA processing